MRIIALFLLLFLFQASAQASCQHQAYKQGFSETLPNSKIVKINDQFLGPTRDQDSIGYCYAYATADMYEHWLKSKNYMAKDQSVSAVALGLLDHKDNWDKRTEEFNQIKPAPQTSLDQRHQESNALYEQAKNLKSEYSQLQQKIIKEKYADVVQEIQSLKQSSKEEDQSKAAALLKDLNQKLKSEDSIKKIIEKFEQVNAELSQTGYPVTISSVYKIEEKDVFNKENKTPVQGGQSQKLLNKLWNNYCFESEVNSKDIEIKKVYTSYRDLLDQSSISPDTLNTALGYINSENFEERSTCASFDLTKSIFASLPFQGPEEFKQFIDSADPQKSLVQQLLQKSCSPKAPPKKPEIVTAKVATVTVPMDDNQDVLTAIDKAIDSGQIASVGYNVNILLSPELNELGAHESTIIGKAKFCGEEAYVLRNTFGAEACHQFLNRYMKHAREKLPVDMEFASCVLDMQEQSKQKFKNCSTGNCLSSKGTFEQEKLLLCLDIRDRNTDQQQLKVPYSCDDKGNFIISKNYFQKGVYLANYISN